MAVMTHRLMQDGYELIRGGELSVRIIFNNLAGRNFEGPQSPWRNGTQEDYLASMEQALRCRIRPDELTIVPVD
jgi:hypothetical protein